MLKIFNTLWPFFEDCYRRINVREYSRIVGISVPKSSYLLKGYEKSGLLKKIKERNYLFFYANKESRDFMDFSRIYWRHKLVGLIAYLESIFTNPIIILFGSLSKAEATMESDIDLVVIARKKGIEVGGFEKKLKRKIQILNFDSMESIQSKELASNIVNGYLLSGRLQWIGKSA